MSDMPDPESAAKIDNEKLQRLRDRTDEIELIISGLTTVALFTLPGWLFETLSYSYSHSTVATSIGATVMLLIVPGLFYGLGACFAVHLMIRAYWAGLIGLRSVFPKGIDWKRTPTLGPVSTEYYKKRLPDLASAITSADHTASALFAVISMIALGVLWIAVLLLISMIVAGLIGAQTGQANQAIQITSILVVSITAAPPLLVWILDAGLARVIPSLTRFRAFRALIHGLARFGGWFWPQKLILPVQLTLQSNTRSFLVALFLATGVASILLIGQLRYNAWTDFTISGEFLYLDDDAVAAGMRSSYYENQRSTRDRLLLYPMIDQFMQERSAMRVFLPYHPLRDNLMIQQQCDRNDVALDCLRRLWSVSLNGKSLEASSLIPTERMDLNLRGLTGVKSLRHLEPGVHELEVVWNPAGVDDGKPLDDRYDFATRLYRIPFMFAPAFEMGLASEVEPATEPMRENDQ